MKVPFLVNPKFLAVANPRRRKKTATKRSGARRKTVRRRKKSTSRRRSRRRNYGTARRRTTARRSYRRNPPRRRRRRARRNPLIPTTLLQRGIAIAAGFIAAPRLAAMVPVELPGGKLGQYVKEFLVVSVGSQIVTKALGRKYGQALFAGGVIHIGVDMLQSYVSPFGANAGGSGVGYYWPPNDELALMYGGTASPGLPEMGANGLQGRLGSRFAA